MKNKLNIPRLVAWLGIICVASGWFYLQMSKVARAPRYVPGGCMIRLHLIDTAKEEWALEHHQATNALPTWDDVRPYLPEHWDFMSNGIPYCSGGGRYTLGAVGAPATCSVGGLGHSYSP